MSTLASLVTGATPAIREGGIKGLLEDGQPTAVILEGLPDGSSPLEVFSSPGSLQVARIAPGCMCCTGNLVMRVTLNRILRSKPERLFIGVASSEHLPAIRDFLSQPPYSEWLTLTDTISYE